MHTLYAPYMQESKLEERTVFSNLFYEEAALSLAICSCPSILIQHFAQWQKVLLKTVKNATGGFSCFNVAAVTAASEAQDAKIVWK